MAYKELIVAIKGGANSGNHGHQGRPGKRGGSAGGSANMSTISAGLNKLADGNSHRRNLVNSAIDALSELEAEGALDNARSIKIVGSFVSNKDKPGDIDIMILTGNADDAGKIQARTEYFNKSLATGKQSTQIFFVEHGQQSGKMLDDWFSVNTREKYGVEPVQIWQDDVAWKK